MWFAAVVQCDVRWCGVYAWGVVAGGCGVCVSGRLCVCLGGCVCVCGVIWDGVLCVLAGVCGVLCSRAPDMI